MVSLRHPNTSHGSKVASRPHSQGRVSKHMNNRSVGTWSDTCILGRGHVHEHLPSTCLEAEDLSDEDRQALMHGFMAPVRNIPIQSPAHPSRAIQPIPFLRSLRPPTPKLNQDLSMQAPKTKTSSEIILDCVLVWGSSFSNSWICFYAHDYGPWRRSPDTPFLMVPGAAAAAAVVVGRQSTRSRDAGLLAACLDEPLGCGA